MCLKRELEGEGSPDAEKKLRCKQPAEMTRHSWQVTEGLWV